MSDTSTILSLPYILPAQAQKHVTHNEAIRLLDVIVQLSVTARDLSVPPAAPMQADRYIVAVGASGDWAGKSGQIAVYDDGAWQFFAPITGWTAWIMGESVLASYDGAAWVSTADGPQTFGQLGISATSDDTNRLTVSSAATLLNHAGAGHQLKINKALVGDTASLLFQTGFSGRAEMGTAGDDDFSIKVSADGAAFVTGVSIAKESGQVTLPAALRLGGQAADPAAPVDGMIWLNTTTGEVKVRSNGVNVVLASASGIGNAQLADMASARIKGRIAAGAGAPQDLTGAEVAGLLPVVTSGAAGLAPASGGGATNFLRADGTWAAPSGGGGDLISMGVTATALQINPLASVQANSFLMGDTSTNLAVGADDFANAAFWPATWLASGITSTKVGSGFSADGRPYVDVRYQGVATGTQHTGGYTSAASDVPATVGDVFTGGFFAKKIAGSTSGVSGMRAQVAGRNAASPYIEGSTSAAVLAIDDTLCSVSHTVANAATTKVVPVIILQVTSGATVDVTYRIYALQFDRAASRQVYKYKAASPAAARAALGIQPSNAIINGNFGINQRGVSGTVVRAPGAYGHDRWKAGAAGCTYTFSTTAGVTTLNITAGSLVQVIEGANLFSGNYVLSWIGTASGKIGGGAFGPSGATAVVTGGANLNIEFGTGTLSRVQFEEGTIASPFQRRHVGDELALCQRYYQHYVEPALRGVASSPSVVNRVGMQLPVVMRTTPTATVGALPVFDGQNVSSVASVLSNHCTDRVAEFGFNVSPANLVAYRPIIIYQSGAAALSLDAEL